MQLAQPRRIEHRTRAPDPTNPKYVGRIGTDGARRAIRQLNHQQQHAVPPLKRPRRQQTPEQRMGLRDNPHIARQHRTQLLQSVAFTLGPNQIHDATQAATTPAARIALALAAVHAARPEAIRTLRLDDVDLGNRRLTIGSVTRPLDELTHRLLIDWLEYRRTLWPNTANPHLIINKQTASTTRAISDNALTAPFRRRTATLEALRVDRQLDEALTHGPDPLHLAVVFGLDETTAIRYCAAARQILQTPAEEHDPPG